jgi:type VI protein secretion system component VasF
MNITFLDIAYPGRPRHPRFPRRVIDSVEQVRKEVTDTAVQVKDAAKDSVAQLQDFVSGGNSGSDDNTMLLWAIIVVFAALLLCLWFAYSYRQRLNVSRR